MYSSSSGDVSCITVAPLSLYEQPLLLQESACADPEDGRGTRCVIRDADTRSRMRSLCVHTLLGDAQRQIAFEGHDPEQCGAH